MKNVWFLIAVMSNLVTVAGPVLADPVTPNNLGIFDFLAGSQVFHQGGGGSAVSRRDEITCVSSQIAAPGGDISNSDTCTNSVGRHADGKLAEAMMRLLAATGSAAGGGGGIAVVLKGNITCTFAQIAAPGGPVDESVSCQ